jgi:hypothetical protein
MGKIRLGLMTNKSNIEFLSKVKADKQTSLAEDSNIEFEQRNPRSRNP